MRDDQTFRLLVLGASEATRAVLRAVADQPLSTVTFPGPSVSSDRAVASATMAWVARRSCLGPNDGTIGLVVLGVDRDEVSAETLAALVEEVDAVCALSAPDAWFDATAYRHRSELAQLLASAPVPVIVAVPEDHVERSAHGRDDQSAAHSAAASPIRLRGRSRVVHRPGDVRSDREVVAAALEQLLVAPSPRPVREVA